MGTYLSKQLLTEIIAALQLSGYDELIKEINLCLPPEEDESLQRFEDFWQRYNKKKSLELSKKKFCKLNKKEQLEILSVVDKYVRDNPDPQFRQHASTFINQKTWKDYLGLNLATETKKWHL